MKRERMDITSRINRTSLILNNGRIAVIDTPFLIRPGLLDRSQRTRRSTNLTQRGDVTPILIGKTQLAPPTDLSNGVQSSTDIRLDGLQYTLDTEVLIRWKHDIRL